MSDDQTNGTLPPAPMLPTFRTEAMRAFIESQQTREHELDTTYRELADAKVIIRQVEAENETLRSHIATLESRTASYVLERDQAVAERVARETSLVAIGGHLEAIYGLLRHIGVSPQAADPHLGDVVDGP
jgi:regulator of replication initiation timing